MRSLVPAVDALDRGGGPVESGVGCVDRWEYVHGVKVVVVVVVEAEVGAGLGVGELHRGSRLFND